MDVKKVLYFWYMFTTQEENTIKKLKKNCAGSDKCQFDIIKKMSSLRIQKPVQKKY